MKLSDWVVSVGFLYSTIQLRSDCWYVTFVVGGKGFSCEYVSESKPRMFDVIQFEQSMSVVDLYHNIRRPFLLFLDEALPANKVQQFLEIR